jgi:hypothetical protein
VYPELKAQVFKNWAMTGDGSEVHAICVACDMPLGSVILQPAGSQSWPDMLMLNHDGRVIPIEAKSVEKDGPPMWNDNVPKTVGLYILSSGSLNSTTMFLGKDVISDNAIRVRAILTAALKTVVDSFRPWVHILDGNNRGWFFTFRPQSFQQGGADVTNYFTHTDRSRCEQNALEFANL